MKITAAVVREQHGEFELEDVLPFPLPGVLGHEGAGVV